MDSIVEFLVRSSSDERRSDEVLKSAIGLLGDLGQTFGIKMQQLYNQPFVTALIQQANKVDDTDIQETAKWTQSVSCLLLLFLII